jgi:hypothetical protein
MIDSLSPPERPAFFAFGELALWAAVPGQPTELRVTVITNFLGQCTAECNLAHKIISPAIRILF